MTGFDSKRQMAADKVLDLDGHVVGKVRKPKREWVGLTDEEKDHLEGLHITVARGAVEAWIEGLDDFIQAIESKLRSKNT
jgi:hypothetical protein